MIGAGSLALKYFVAPISFLWPGFGGVARYGLWSQLGIALVFGAHCQATLALNFLWCDYLSNFCKTSLCVALFLSWIILGAVASSRLKRYEKTRSFDSDGSVFREAQTRYLKGEWFEAERCLKEILGKNSSDPEALLMLATLYRHIGRRGEAKTVLSDLEKLDASYRWRYEIALERKMLKEEERVACADSARTGNSSTSAKEPERAEERAAKAVSRSEEQSEKLSVSDELKVA